MADLSAALVSRGLDVALFGHIDVEGKIPAALEALGPLAGREVVLLDAGGGVRARQLAERGAAVTALLPSIPPRPAAVDRGTALPGGVRLAAGRPEATGLPASTADVVVSTWSAFEGPDPVQLAEAERILRPGGRLLIVHDYGRDDVCLLWRDAFSRQVEWSRRNGPFLGIGFRIRVIHCWWTFDSMEQAEELLGNGFGEAGREVAQRMKRPRLEYNIAIYHRTKEPSSTVAVLAGSTFE